MCGIAGFCLNAEEHIDARKLSEMLLKQIVSRGRDATGAAWYNAKRNEVRYTKAPYSAHTFVNSRLPLMPSGVKNVILHTRFATQGDKKYEANNHPIVINNLVGVHNGHISNDDAILKRYPEHQRLGQVDSEAAFAMAKYEANPLEAFADIEGRAALAWIDGDSGRELNLTRVSGSPLCVAQTPKGSTIFASTKPLLERAMKDVGLKIEWIAELDEYEYMKVRNGAIVEYTDFKPSWVKELEKFEETKYAWDWSDTDLGKEHGGWMHSVM
jgi:glucosamine 6-phosphate synthetase-like amidotransferase/phosphosugar isomerase protein